MGEIFWTWLVLLVVGGVANIALAVYFPETKRSSPFWARSAVACFFPFVLYFSLSLLLPEGFSDYSAIVAAMSAAPEMGVLTTLISAMIALLLRLRWSSLFKQIDWACVTGVGATPALLLAIYLLQQQVPVLTVPTALAVTVSGVALGAVLSEVMRVGIER